MLSQASQAHGLPQASHRPDQRLTGTTSRGQRRLLAVSGRAGKCRIPELRRSSYVGIQTAWSWAK